MELACEIAQWRGLSVMLRNNKVGTLLHRTMTEGPTQYQPPAHSKNEQYSHQTLTGSQETYQSETEVASFQLELLGEALDLIRIYKGVCVQGEVSLG
jgi:hypothetical protein